MTHHYTPSGRELEAARSANTNDLGEYRIFDVPAGKYFLKVGQRNLRLNNNPEDGEAYGSVFYPGYPQVSGAIVQEVAPGQQLRNLNFNLRKTRYATIRGKVVAPPNATSVSAGMMIVTDNGQSSSSGDVKGKDIPVRVLRRQPRSALPDRQLRPEWPALYYQPLPRSRRERY